MKDATLSFDKKAIDKMSDEIAQSWIAIFSVASSEFESNIRSFNTRTLLAVN